MNFINIANERAQALNVLGLQKAHSRTELRAAWKEMVRASHPDACNGPQADFVEVQSAYELLLRDLEDTPSASSNCGTARRERVHTRPRRAEQTMRIVHFSSELVERCTELLVRSTKDRPGALFLHIPMSIQIGGRSVRYNFGSRFAEGRNVFALPLRGFDNAEKAQIRMISISAHSDAPGSLELRPETVEKFFPRRDTVQLQTV